MYREKKIKIKMLKIGSWIALKRWGLTPPFTCQHYMK